MRQEVEKRAKELIEWAKGKLTDDNSVDEILERIEQIFEEGIDTDYDVMKAAICKVLAEVISKLQNTNVIKRLNKAADMCNSARMYKEAEELCHRSISIQEEIEETQTKEYARSLHILLKTLAEAYRLMGRMSEAENTYQQSLEITKQILGENSIEYASNLHGLADVYVNLDKLDDAESTYKRSIKMIEQIEGKNTHDYASGLNNLANVYESVGQFSDAIDSYQQSLAIQKKLNCSNTLGYAAGLYGIANVYSSINQLVKAKSAYLKSLGIQKEITGEKTLNYAIGLNNLANVYKRLGNMDKAENAYVRSLDIQRQISGEESVGYVSILNNLANIYKDLGRLSEAETMYLHSLDIQEKLGVEETSGYITGSLGLADVYAGSGRQREAEVMYKRSIKILKTIEPTMLYAYGLIGLAGVYYRLGKYSEAKAIYLHSLEIIGRLVSKQNLDYAVVLNNLGNVYCKIDELADAESSYLSCLEIRKNITGENTLDYIPPLSNLILLYKKNNDINKAYEFAIKIVEICRNVISKMSITSSRESIHSTSIELSIYYQLLISLLDSLKKKDPHAIELLAERKTSELHISRFRDNIIDKLADETEKEKLELLEKKLSEIQANKKRTKEAQNQGLLSKEEEKRREYFLIESTVLNRARKGTGFKRKVIPSGFHQEDEIILDFCSYNDYASVDRTPKYCALVYKPSKEKEGEIVFLGEAEGIDNAINEFRKELASNGDNIKEIERNLHSSIFQPLLKKVPELKDASRITICADGELTKLPFELIIPDKQIRYLTSGTDGEWIGLSQTKNSDDIVSGNPVCGEAQGTYKDNNNNSRAGFPMSDLKYSGPECERIEELLNARAKGEDKYLVQADFRKENVMKISRPRIWHISTHGFFYENEEKEVRLETLNLHPFEQQLMSLQDPYRRCGLALFRANRAMEGPEEAEKVLLTGRDILELDLTGTDLIVLSACQTALGDVHNGDGIWGLQRAFMLAGVKTLIISLWSVDDLATSILMDNMYKGILSGKRIDESLQEAKRYVRESTRAEFKEDGWAVDANKGSDKPYKAPYYWAGFICLGDGGKVNIN